MNRIFFFLLLSITCFATADAQSQHYVSHISIGGKAGVTISKMSFSPGVKQSMVIGTMEGITFRYAEERHFGLIIELNVEQRGWKENFEDARFSYSRTLTYLQLPLLTHITFGSPKFKFFCNLGPEFGYMIGSNIKANFDYNNISSIDGFPSANRMTEQLGMEISNKFDYGISGGVGAEYVVKRKHSILLEGRFYYGLGNIFPSHKSDVFAASRSMSIMVTLGYMFRIK